MTKGCEWNNSLAKENFETNVQKHGIDYAKQVLRTDIHHWMAKREGRPIPEWKASVDDGGHLVVEKQRLIDLTSAPLTKEVDAPISEEVKALVPIEIETVWQADRQASQGAKKIYMPEHAPGGIRYITVYSQSADNPREYIGSQIDLGENLSWDQAKERMQKMEGKGATALFQSTQHKEAFVFAEERKVVKQHQKAFADRVLTDVASTVASAGIFAMETLRRKRAQKQLEMKEIKKKKEKAAPISVERKKQKKHKEKKINKRLIQAVTLGYFAAETGVGIGGAIFMLRLISQPEKKKKRLQRKVRERKKENYPRKQKQFKHKELHVIKKTERKKQKQERGEVKRKVKPKEQKMLKSKERKREKLMRKKERHPVRIMRKLARMLRELPTTKNKTYNEKKPVQVRRETRRKQKEHIVRFAFAWALWFMVKPRIGNKDIHMSTDQKRKKEKNVQVKEPTTWILFAILWHLSMIRKERRRLPQKKQKKKQSQTKMLPQQAVIFAFPS